MPWGRIPLSVKYFGTSSLSPNPCLFQGWIATLQASEHILHVSPRQATLHRTVPHHQPQRHVHDCALTQPSQFPLSPLPQSLLRSSFSLGGSSKAGRQGGRAECVRLSESESLLQCNHERRVPPPRSEFYQRWQKTTTAYNPAVEDKDKINEYTWTISLSPFQNRDRIAQLVMLLPTIHVSLLPKRGGRGDTGRPGLFPTLGHHSFRCGFATVVMIEQGRVARNVEQAAGTGVWVVTQSKDQSDWQLQSVSEWVSESEWALARRGIKQWSTQV